MEKNENEKIEVIEKHNQEKGILLLYVNDVRAGEMTFVFAKEDKIIVDHTGINEEFEGRGYGKILVEKIVLFARENHIKIIPLCPYAKRVINSTEEYHDILN
ncbi:MAG: N-acetyltransferase [Bacteroidales bacterium]|jgi:predicted GNAT family acetyltransferase|nr:N-acetyltransferase [Bacteroidales bacterium]